MYFPGQCSSSQLGLEVHSRCCRVWGQTAGGRPADRLHWCYYSLCLSLGFLGGFGWSGLQTKPLEAENPPDCDSSGCCSSLGAEWGFHTTRGARLVPSTLRCTCRLGKAQCAHRSNLHVLWTDWKWSPVDRIGTGPAAENTRSSERNGHRKETSLQESFKMDALWVGKRVCRNTWWTSKCFFSIFRPHLHVIWKECENDFKDTIIQ